MVYPDMAALLGRSGLTPVPRAEVSDVIYFPGDGVTPLDNTTFEDKQGLRPPAWPDNAASTKAKVTEYATAMVGFDSKFKDKEWWSAEHITVDQARTPPLGHTPSCTAYATR
jgi:hypothetical protein